jgi:predicted dehydrogenase
MQCHSQGGNPIRNTCVSAENVTRREFIRSTAARAAAAGTLLVPSTARGNSPAERLRVGFLGVGQRGLTHLNTVLDLARDGRNIEAAAVCDVFNRKRVEAVGRIRRRADSYPRSTSDYREIIADPNIDAVCIATPDHWHARMALDALAAGKHVYCESPMTRSIAEAEELLAAWRTSGRVMQVGVQSTSDGRWRAAHDFLCQGGIGKVVHAQAEAFRNSSTGQWRYCGLSRDMTPANIDWPMFLGTEFGLAPEMPFDRAAYAQWRCYWPFSSGPFSELFVPQLTRLLIALGVDYPRRVTSGGGIFMEYDGRDVPDTATLVCDYDQGLQIVLMATTVNDHVIEHCIRGHHGTLVFDLSRDGFDFLPQRPQVTRQPERRREHVPAFRPLDETLAHWENFLDAIAGNAPSACNNRPDLAAAAVTTIALGVESYRNGMTWEWDATRRHAVASSRGFAQQWEQLSQRTAMPRHSAGWSRDPSHGSRQTPPTYQRLAGPWKDDLDPAV